ncbi:PREDICTED: protein MIZU-KUSSEI 1 [Tarenaya hassleriana]|uniref:protein MIZU-KUSSEI 1 n=1 Tax=Tarenaya hassleriana TaxID=28532 RepID=UPI00053C3536|nr:PREDICTED: protein MIZU-KUSSEI 1 [Tarenaya hassleriana]
MSFTTTTGRRHRFTAATAGTDSTTAVDCHKQVRSWRVLRTIVQLLLPSCYCTFVEPNPHDSRKQTSRKRNSHRNAATFTGTIFGFRRGKVNFCIQATSVGTLNPIIVLLELAVPTEVLAQEMRGGVLRIALESNNTYWDNGNDESLSHLLSTPLWNMYCNGRKVGFAIKREPSKAELAALNVLSSVTEGAGVINADEKDHVMYLRASFERVFGSSDSESFHLIDPHGIIGQELSIFFFRK